MLSYIDRYNGFKLVNDIYDVWWKHNRIVRGNTVRTCEGERFILKNGSNDPVALKRIRRSRNYIFYS